MFLATGIAARLLDPLVDALQVKGGPAFVAGPDWGTTRNSADADHAFVDTPAKLICKLLGQRAHFHSDDARLLVASAPGPGPSSSLAPAMISPLPLLLGSNRLCCSPTSNRRCFF